MRLIVALDHRFHRTPDGVVRVGTMCDYAFWTRYLDVFDEVRVLGRTAESPAAPDGYQRADGLGVSFASVPAYSGPLGYLRQARTIAETIRRELRSDDAILLRMGPSQVAVCVGKQALAAGHPYALEMIGDPETVFAPGSLRHPLSPLFRWWSPRQQRVFCTGACAVGYVTREALQRRYPSAPDAFSTYYSSITLTDDAFAPGPRKRAGESRKHRIAFVGALSQLYKGPDVLIDAVADCINRRGLDIELAMMGDGVYRASLEAQTARLGIGNRVVFLGQLPAGRAVRDELDRADLFVLPSRTEGLPKAVIEAMARGLPCVGSDVGGIPELLPPEYLAPPGDAEALASRIAGLLTDRAAADRAAAQCFERAREYHIDILRARRRALYQHLHDKTAEWLKRQRS